jgi:hypothetical protein
MSTSRAAPSLPTAICILVLSSCPAVLGRTIYVDDDAPASGDGSSWATAHRFLQDALAAAWSLPGEIEIRVAQGIYKPDRSSAHPEGTRDRAAFFYLAGGYTLRGGYAGVTGDDPNLRDSQRYPSVLSGDLAGDDVELENPLDAQGEPTRADNSYHLVMNHSGTRIVRPVAWGRTGELDGFLITGGHAPNEVWVAGQNYGENPGAGVYITGSQYGLSPRVVIRDCTIVGNYARAGGGALACAYGDVVLVGCTIAANGTHRDGAGIRARYSKVELTNCRFQENRAGGAGGGLSGEGSDVKLSRCDFSSNVARFAGALNLDGTAASSEVMECAFLHNRAESVGGAVATLIGDVRMYACRFVANKAGTDGGAIHNLANMALANCLFSGNTAGLVGGAVSTYFGELTIANCTAHGNRAPKGRLLFCDVGNAVVRGPVYISDSIVVDGSGDIWVDYDGAITIQYTCLADAPDAIHGPQGTITLGQGNISVDPCFAVPGYWDPTRTAENLDDDFWVDGDYHLKSRVGRWDPTDAEWIMDEASSFCIDAGDPNSPVGDEPLPNGGRVNMGAYGGTAEASKSYFGEPVCETVIAGDINGDCRVDCRDFEIIGLNWLRSSRE